MSESTKTILVVDDDPGHRTMLKTLMGGWNYRVEVADDGSTGLEAIQNQAFDVVLMDMKMLKMSGMEALERITAYNPSLPVIIMTAYSSVDTAVEALKKGAMDYLTKPLDFDKLRLTLDRLFETIHLRKENKSLKQRLGDKFSRESIIGKSTAMTALLTTVEMAAPSNANILITGESGTGKELIAGAVHYNSSRRDGPFVCINCAAITETLLESELFGHERGAFTGADKKRTGRFLQAHKGSILLDEIGEMSMAMQAKLLRVIQEKEVTPVGSEKTIITDVRVIASTNRDLKQCVTEGSFREDLYFRLNVVTLEIPPLRKRPEDIPELALHFLQLFSRKNQRDIKGFSPKAMDAMIHYQWQGNVRELMNTIERAVVLTSSDYLSMEDLPFIASSVDGTDKVSNLDFSRISLSEVEKKAILQTLAAVEGNRSEAARRLGITRKTLLKKLKDYGEA